MMLDKKKNAYFITCINWGLWMVFSQSAVSLEQNLIKSTGMFEQFFQNLF